MQRLSSNFAIIYSIILDNNGKVLAHNDIAQWGKVFNNKTTINAILATTPLVQNFMHNNKLYYDISFPITIKQKVNTQLSNTNVMSIRIATLRIGLATAGLESQWNSISIFGILVTTIILLLFYLNFLSKPLNKIISFSTAIGNGILGQRLDKKLTARSDEIGKLSNVIENLATNLAQFYSDHNNATQRVTPIFNAFGSILDSKLIIADDRNRIIFTDSQLILGDSSEPQQLIGKHLLELSTDKEWVDIIQKSINQPNSIINTTWDKNNLELKLLTIKKSEGSISGTIIMVKNKTR